MIDLDFGKIVVNVHRNLGKRKWPTRKKKSRTREGWLIRRKGAKVEVIFFFLLFNGDEERSDHSKDFID